MYECSVFETCQPIRFHKDGTQAYMITNKGDVDLIGLVLLDPAASKTTLVESDPKKRVDLGNTIFSDKTGDLLATQYEDERVRWYVKDPTFKADFEFLEKRFPGKDVNFQSSTADEQRWIVVAASDTDPGEVFVYDRATKKVTPQYKVREKLQRDQLAPMTTLAYPSSDGLSIPAYLTLPRGVPAKALPLMVVPHGGPWGRDTWGYDTFAQFLANRGYAVLQPNFRASTGYGKKFLNLGNGKWGETMQDDITWGVKHLVAQGTVDPKRVGIMGGSYGGYATLAGVAFTPDLYAAGVAIVAPSNLLTLLDSIPPYWESVRTVFNVRMGDPGEGGGQGALDEAVAAQLGRQDPHAADGGAGPERSTREARRVRSDRDCAARPRLPGGIPRRARRRPWLRAAGQQHGDDRQHREVPRQAPGRAVPGGSAGRRGDPAEGDHGGSEDRDADRAAPTAAASAPKPVADLAPMKANYSASIAMGGQNMAMKIAQEAREENGAWVFTETADTPMGAATDSAVIEKGTLLVKKRTVKQGPADIALDFSDKAITGTLSMNGQARPVNVALDGPIFADGPGSYAVIARLPLAQGYTTSFRNLDLRTQKVEVKQLAVVGTRVGHGAGRHVRRLEGRGEGRRRWRHDALGGRRLAPGREDHRDATGDEWRRAHRGAGEVRRRGTPGWDSPALPWKVAARCQQGSGPLSQRADALRRAILRTLPVDDGEDDEDREDDQRHLHPADRVRAAHASVRGVDHHLVGASAVHVRHHVHRHQHVLERAAGPRRRHLEVLVRVAGDLPRCTSGGPPPACAPVPARRRPRGSPGTARRRDPRGRRCRTAAGPGVGNGSTCASRPWSMPFVPGNQQVVEEVIDHA